MARKKTITEDKEVAIEDKKEEDKEEVVEDKNIIECVVIASNFGRFQTGETLELAKEIFAKYENLGYLKRK